MGYKKRGLALLAIAVTAATPAWAEDVEREAVIVSAAENSLSVRTREGPLTIVLTPTTTIRETS